VIEPPAPDPYDVEHCHIGHHLSNDSEDPGGLILLLDAGR